MVRVVVVAPAATAAPPRTLLVQLGQLEGWQFKRVEKMAQKFAGKWPKMTKEIKDRVCEILTSLSPKKAFIVKNRPQNP